MLTDIYKASLETSFEELRKKVVEENRRFIPVVDNGVIVGCITRTDILRHIHAEYPLDEEKSGFGFKTKERSLTHLIEKKLPENIRDILSEFGRTADEIGVKVYAVGGFVRDLILGIENLDIDITVEGDGIFFAENFVASHNCRMRSHDRFKTATIIFPDLLKIDVASTRLEYYKSPGALPTVERSSLRHDLYRRDFTINTLAISLNFETFGKVTDFFGGFDDINRKVIKALHNFSFVEDPCRIFRAIRFEQRLDFKISKHTENLMKSEIRSGWIEKISGGRIFNELKHILKEKDPVKPVLRMGELKVFHSIHKHFAFTDETREILEESKELLGWIKHLYINEKVEVWELYFLALTNQMSNEDFREVVEKLQIPHKIAGHSFRQRARVKRIASILKRSSKHQKISNSFIYGILHDLSIESILYLVAISKDEKVRKAATLYLSKLRYIKLCIDGNHLKSLAIPPSASYKKILDALLKLKLDGEIFTKEDEVSTLQKLLLSVNHKNLSP